MANDAERQEHLSSVFATMVMQLTNMAAMFLGRVPNPETNQPTVDLEAAQIFIDQLEMLESKTKGNLSKEEQDILKQGLTVARMAFVEAANAGAQKTTTPAAAAPSTPAQPTSPDAGAAAEAEGRKKFTKKY